MLTPFRRILLCYDGSPESYRALRCGAMLARKMESEVHLLSLVDAGFWSVGFDVLSSVRYDVDESAAKEALRDGLKNLSDWEITATGHYAVGNAVSEISKLAKALNIDLIIVGYHAHGFFSRLWTEENQVQLLSQVACGVLFETST